MAALQTAQVTVCGAGALGANLVEALARAGVGRLSVIDFDRIEERNLATQPYGRADIGRPKARILSHHLYRALAVRVEAHATRLEASNVRKLLRGSQLVVDVFDNSASRRLVTEHCAAHDIPCLHAGLGEGYGEVLWNEEYRVPEDAEEDVCDYPLARNLVMLVVSVAAELAMRFLISGARQGQTITLEDFAVRAFPPSG